MEAFCGYSVEFTVEKIPCIKQNYLVSSIGFIALTGHKEELQYGYCFEIIICLFVCVEVLWPSQPNRVMSSAVTLPNHTFTGQA